MIIFELILTVLMSYIFIRQIVKYANYIGLLDVPNDRSHHKQITPRGAGIGFIAALFISIFVFKTHIVVEFWYIFVAVGMVLLVGIVDDIYEIGVRSKIVMIAFATVWLWAFHISIDGFGYCFGSYLTLGWLVLPFTLFAVVAFTNAFNLIDGLDGLAGSLAIVILLSFAYVAHDYHNELVFYLCIFTVSAVIGFMFLNWHPAKVFMGDSGSLTLGFLISVIAILSIRDIPPVVIFYIAAMPILDTLVVMTRRISNKENPFRPDKKHLHHVLIRFLNGDVKKSVLFLTALQILFAFAGLLLINVIQEDKTGSIAPVALIVFGAIYILFYFVAKKMDRGLESGVENKYT